VLILDNEQTGNAWTANDVQNLFRSRSWAAVVPGWYDGRCTSNAADLLQCQKSAGLVSEASLEYLPSQVDMIFCQLSISTRALPPCTHRGRANLIDFGLVLDKSFTVAGDEMSFFKANTHYEY
jgi:hypothetical protein